MCAPIISKAALNSFVYIFFLVILGFELRDLCLLGRGPTYPLVDTCPQPFVCLSYFSDKVIIFDQGTTPPYLLRYNWHNIAYTYRV
jgi:hypothetical protein